MCTYHVRVARLPIRRVTFMAQVKRLYAAASLAVRIFLYVNTFCDNEAFGTLLTWIFKHQEQKSHRIFAHFRLFLRKKPFGRPNFFHRSSNGCFRKWWYPQIIQFNRDFHYKSSILGYPYFWKHPNGEVLQWKRLAAHREKLWQQVNGASSRFPIFVINLHLPFFEKNIGLYNMYIYIYIYIIYIYMYICRTFPPKKGVVKVRVW